LPNNPPLALKRGDWCTQEVVGERGHLEEHSLYSFVVNEFEDEVWPMRARTAAETLKGFAHVRREGFRLHLPIYAHHGTADILADIKVCCPCI
jgi:hypothetical protein